MKKRTLIFSLLLVGILSVALSVGITMAKYFSTLEGTPFEIDIGEHDKYTYAVLENDPNTNTKTKLSIRNRKAAIVTDENGNPIQLVDKDGTYALGDNGDVYALPNSSNHGGATGTDASLTPNQPIVEGEAPEGAIKGKWITYLGSKGDLEDTVTSVTVADSVSFKNDLVTLFQQWTNLTSVDFSNAKINGVVGTHKMFDNCLKLQTIILPSVIGEWQVKNMKQMFYQCSALTSIVFADFTAPELTTMYGLFSGCNGLQSATFGDIIARKLTTMSAMFPGGNLLVNFKSAIFNGKVETPSLTDMSGMFRQCQALTTIDFGDSFDTSAVTNMNYLFWDCKSLKSLDVSGFDTSNAIYMNNMFGACSGLNKLDISNFDTSNVQDMGNMFSGCSGLTELKWDVGKFKTSNVTDMSGMFSNCLNITVLDLSHFDTSDVTNMSSMFNTCKKLINLDLSSFDTSKVTSMDSMFKDYKHSTIYVSDKFVTVSLSSTANVFTWADSLTGGNGTKVGDMRYTHDVNHYHDAKYAVIDGVGGQPGYFTAAPHTNHGTASYIDNGDGTHTQYCGVYGEPITNDEAHTYTDGVCVCGHSVDATNDRFTLEGATGVKITELDKEEALEKNQDGVDHLYSYISVSSEQHVWESYDENAGDIVKKYVGDVFYLSLEGTISGNDILNMRTDINYSNNSIYADLAIAVFIPEGPDPYIDTNPGITNTNLTVELTKERLYDMIDCTAGYVAIVILYGNAN